MGIRYGFQTIAAIEALQNGKGSATVFAAGGNQHAFSASFNKTDIMSDQAILITGANGGIGNATARYFLERDPDAFVYLGIRSNRAACDALSEEFPGRCGILTLDVTSPDAWEAALWKRGKGRPRHHGPGQQRRPS